MQSGLAEMLAPHYCISCDEIGSVLCDRCIYDITSDSFGQCVKCTTPTQGGRLCQTCRGGTAYHEAWCAGTREGALEALLSAYKFERTKSAYQPLAQLLDKSLPRLPVDTVVTSVPTISPHIRRRGYDHAELLAKEFARLRSLPYRRLLARANTSVQLGATKQQRLDQARRAFRPIKSHQIPLVLLIDDVYTTGATVEHAARALRSSGAGEVMVALVARQLLD